MENKQLILFVKNKELGKVKTRLAKTIGNEKALFIYKALLQHTCRVAGGVDALRKVYYSNFVDSNDEFEGDLFEKRIQVEADLGIKMYEAFKESFGEQAEKVILIGSDCYEIDSTIIENAFKSLDDNDFVLGPANDGGYYLVGMKKLSKSIFENMVWSTENVLLDTIIEIKSQNKSFFLLPTLTDVDEEKDLGELKNFI
jgi:rSAM/selenodomain-associated transferase 1